MRAARRRDAIVTVWVAVVLIVLIGIGGLASDLAFVVLVGNQLQNGADASALAGALKVRASTDEARAAAIQVASLNLANKSPILLDANLANGVDGDVVIGVYDREARLFTPTLDSPNAVKVAARRTDGSRGGKLPLVFGPIFGVQDVNVERSAIAMIGGGTGAGMIVLDRNARHALEVSGDATLAVRGGDIQVNSSHKEAFYANGNPVIDTPNVNIVGDYKLAGGATVTGDINTQQNCLPDPLAFLEPPNIPPPHSPGGITNSGTYQPGYYPQGISIQSQADVRLEPGLYVLDGAGLDIRGGGSFIAHNVMLYIVGAGKVYLGGNGQVSITPVPLDLNQPPPDQNLDAPHPGVSIFMQRGNTNESTIIGTGQLDIKGTIYLRDALLNVGGTGDGFGNQLIVGRANVFGTGVKTIVYDGRFPAIGNKVFLVE